MSDHSIPRGISLKVPAGRNTLAAPWAVEWCSRALLFSLIPFLVSYALLGL